MFILGHISTPAGFRYAHYLHVLANSQPLIIQPPRLPLRLSRPPRKALPPLGRPRRAKIPRPNCAIRPRQIRSSQTPETAIRNERCSQQQPAAEGYTVPVLSQGIWNSSAEERGEERGGGGKCGVWGGGR